MIAKLLGKLKVNAFLSTTNKGQRARKGVFITTSNFTRDAKEYVDTIDSKIVLIDGKQLAEYMIDHDIGVSTTKTYEIKRVDSDYFAENSENP